ncbi:isochorismatase family protein [Candidatus Bathyarchaeota archaeon]|nr:isochorismatase family protein [Candidatus Bathyarchaeota archaeon]
MRFHGLLSREKSVLVIIDVQEKRFPLIHDKERVLENLRKLIQFAKIVGMSIILTEQYPKGLGRTIPGDKRDPSRRLSSAALAPRNLEMS